MRAAKRHVDLEESRLFLLAYEALDREQAVAMHEAYDAAEETEKQRLL
jgi:hemerythrin-like domain-containing protein